MKLVNAEYELDLEFTENRHNVFIIESQPRYAKFLRELWDQYNDGTGSFILSESGKLLKMEKLSLPIFNPFSLSLADRVITNALYREMSAYARDALAEKHAELNAAILDFVEASAQGVPYPVTFEPETSPEELYKLIKVSVENTGSSFAESVALYIKVLSKLAGIKLMIFINLSSFLTLAELELVYQVADYEKISILLLENKERTWLPSEKIDILDEDYCLIKLY